MAKIVIVEDDDATRAGYRELLNLAGHEVIATSTYQEGRHAVQVESPDLVIADLPPFNNRPALPSVHIYFPGDRAGRADPQHQAGLNP